MKIKKNKTIKAFKEEFHKIFPGLKIEFFSTAHGHHEGSNKRTIYDEDTLFGDIIQQGKEGELIMDANMRVSEMEAKMKQLFDLNVQVYRRSNDLWLQTISTDDLTLETQNRKGLHSIQENTKLKQWISK